MDAKQVAQWYEECGADLLLYARNLTRDQQAEDVVQEAFVRLLRQPACPDHVRAWLFRVVKNESVSLFRRVCVRRLLGRQSDTGATQWFESRVDDLMDAQTVQSVLETLPGYMREVVVLRIWGRMSLQEAARIVNKPVSTVHHWYQEALETMRQRLEPTSCAMKKD
ncbi:MAG: RNA polymerase sigma factor [Phycisphaerae bacterium]|nr:RNA polymerase sigma factor [Phycisphaerae bacterium]